MTLVYVMHPDMQKSVRCKEVLEHLKTLKNVQFRQVDEKYVYSAENIKAEQEMMLKATRVVFLYPVYWWALPGHTKMFLDKVFQPNFAYVYGVPHHAKLAGKKFRAVMTTGGPSAYYKDTAVLTANMTQIYGDYMGMAVEEPFVYCSDQKKDALKALHFE